MWRPFLNKKNTENSPENYNMEIHNEKTQKISIKPDLTSLERGFMRCPRCRSKMALNKFPPLALNKCPKCSKPNFVPLRISNYWLYEPLGGGGMGSVYHAFHRKDKNMEFAIKLLPRKEKNNTYLIDSLLTEAKIGRRFGKHPHLTMVYEFGCCGDEYYAVYEYVDGIRLDQVIDSPVSLPEKQLVLWSLQILSAEQHMYDCGYLFRDLKPQNIIIDCNGNVKLIDYGLAMTLEAALNEISDEIEGSPYYIPPERVMGAGESQCSEIYSLGMILFHALAQTPYYSSTSDIIELLKKHVSSPRINDVSKKLPCKTSPELVSIIKKMISRDSKRRYQTYKQLGSELFQLYKKCA